MSNDFRFISNHYSDLIPQLPTLACYHQRSGGTSGLPFSKKGSSRAQTTSKKKLATKSPADAKDKARTGVPGPLTRSRSHSQPRPATTASSRRLSLQQGGQDSGSGDSDGGRRVTRSSKSKSMVRGNATTTAAANGSSAKALNRTQTEGDVSSSAAAMPANTRKTSKSKHRRSISHDTKVGNSSDALARAVAQAAAEVVATVPGQILVVGKSARGAAAKQTWEWDGGQSEPSANDVGAEEMDGRRELDYSDTDDFEQEDDHEDEDDFLHGSRIHVVVRKRPPRSDGDTDVVDCAPPRCVVHEPKKKVDLTEYVHPHEFLFDDSFGAEADTTDVYRRSVHSLVHNLFQGGTSTCFCFGETASGKTYTLFGECGTVGGGKGEVASPSSPEGLYMMAARRIFDEAAEASSPGQDGMLEPGFAGGIGVSMFEIYGQKVFDLLNGSNALTALEDAKGVLQLVGLSRHYCDDIDTFMAKTSAGRAARSTSSTGANQTSSRSHAVMAVYLLNREHMVQDGSGVSYTPDNAVEVIGKLSLIDLAGSERGVDNAETDKTTRMEGRQINTSLLALKEVIRSLEGKRSHAPFRQSRLTQVLQESLTGNLCQTVVVACISAALENCQQTLNTLRYAEGLKKRKAKKRLSV